MSASAEKQAEIHWREAAVIAFLVRGPATLDEVWRGARPRLTRKDAYNTLTKLAREKRIGYAVYAGNDRSVTSIYKLPGVGRAAP